MSLFSNLRGKGKKDKNFENENRRKYIRVSAHHLLKYKLAEKKEEMSFGRNISAGGVLFFAKEDLPAGAVVELKINFPQYPHPIEATAKIVRTKTLKGAEGFEVAAEFIHVDEDAKDFINKRIEAIS